MSILDMVTIDSVREAISREDKIKRVLNDENSDYKMAIFDYNLVKNSAVVIPKLMKIEKDNGKHRDIYVYDPVTTGIMSVINDLMNEKYGHLISKDVYSYKKGISVDIPIRELINNLGEHIVLVDVQDFFNSLNGDVVVDYLKWDIQDDELIRYLRDMVRMPHVDVKGKLQKKSSSIPAGNPLSAFLTNYALSKIDNFVREKLKFYARYGDDIVMVSDDYDTVMDAMDELMYRIREFGLAINESKTQIVKKGEPFEYLGCLIIGTTRHVSKKHLRRRKMSIKAAGRRWAKLYASPEMYSKKDILKKHIHDVNMTLLNGGMTRSTVGSLIPNSDTLEELKELDKYIVDNIRQSYFGRHNNHIKSLLPDKELYSMNLVKLVDVKKFGQPYIDEILKKSYHASRVTSDLTINPYKLILKPKAIADYLSTGRLLEFEKPEVLSCGSILEKCILFPDIDVPEETKDYIRFILGPFSGNVYDEMEFRYKTGVQESSLNGMICLPKNISINLCNLLRGDSEDEKDSSGC